jgi:hypothetical protein
MMFYYFLKNIYIVIPNPIIIKKKKLVHYFHFDYNDLYVWGYSSIGRAYGWHS